MTTDTKKRAGLRLPEEFLKELLGVSQDLILVGAQWQPQWHTVQLYFAGEGLPPCPEGADPINLPVHHFPTGRPKSAKPFLRIAAQARIAAGCTRAECDACPLCSDCPKWDPEATRGQANVDWNTFPGKVYDPNDR